MNVDLNPYLITAEQFDEFFAAQVRSTRARLEDKPTSLMPILAVIVRDMEQKDGMVIAAMPDFNEAAEKRESMRRAGRAIFERRLVPLAASLSCEAWLAAQDEIPPGCEPRHSPTKREAVILVAQSFDLKFNKISSIIVTRDAEDRMLEKETLPENEYSEVHSGLLEQFFRGFAETLLKR